MIRPQVYCFVFDVGAIESIQTNNNNLGLPLLVDQYDNMLRITDRGAGKTLDITKLESSVFAQAIRDLIRNKSYTEAVGNMSRLHRLKQNHPLDVAIYNIEYVI